MEFDAFDAGIEMGGLRKKSEIKLLICYLLKSIDEAITRQQINDILQEHGLANYFEINQAISDLLKNGNITISDVYDEETLTITETGRGAAQMLEVSLPKSVREKAINAAIKLLTRARREQENKIEVEKLEKGGYHVTFTVYDIKDELMRLTIYVADSMQVETVRKNFLDDPVKFYSGIVTALTVD